MEHRIEKSDTLKIIEIKNKIHNNDYKKLKNKNIIRYIYFFHGQNLKLHMESAFIYIDECSCQK